MLLEITRSHSIPSQAQTHSHCDRQRVLNVRTLYRCHLVLGAPVKSDYILPTLIIVAATAAQATACTSATESADALLRVHNVGTLPIAALRVASPEASTEFGEVGVGATTDYQPTAGVYPYAAFRYTVEGQTRFQPVLDFVGAVPEAGRRFTYNVELIRLTNDSLWLALRSITRDK